MTWQDLAKLVYDKMSDEQRNTDVTVHCTIADEWFKVDGDLEITQHDDVLHKGHPFLEILV